MLNTIFNCERANWFQASNRDKRKLNHKIASIDSLEEDYKDLYLPEDVTQKISVDNYKYMVQEFFKNNFIFFYQFIIHYILL